ncbi:hypothetical protein BV913_07370 [Neisseria dumasiana]|uniref:AlpA family phage regulatory protein n=2 Tax=Neisseria TaxID=482 RepID=A0ABX3WKI5_9NEIS|nr:hypothetical protein BV913_07370 [Neisseria dumasiana]
MKGNIMLLTRKEVAKKLALSASKLDEIRKNDITFPQPLYLTESKKMIRWKDSDVEAWIESKRIF